MAVFMPVSLETVSSLPGRIAETPVPSGERLQFARERSGRYVFKDWVEVAPGKFEARPSHSSADHHPALISTAYGNANGLSTVYGLVFDLDVFDPSAPTKTSADRKWEDAEGKLDWSRMERALRAECPELAAAITHVVRSSGGRGLAVIVGINPLPIQPSTTKNQTSARSLQGRIAGVFSRLGFGPDPGARGLERDFPNWRDLARVVFLDTSKVRSIETAREPVVTKLHRVLNRLDKAREPFRLYRDARVEVGLARLALWLLGEFEPPKPKQLQLPSELSLFGIGSAQPGLRLLGHFAEEQACATVRDLMHLLDLSEGFVRGVLSEPPEWLRVERISREEGWLLWVPLGANLGDLVTRARDLHWRGKATTVGSAWDPRELSRPENVEDGSRNRWIVQVALSYKWAGLSYETALAKIRLRIAFVPGCATSKNCRLVKKIVKNIYRRMPENEGRFPHRDLPVWLRDDREFLEQSSPNQDCSFVTRLNMGRGIAPTAAEAPLALHPLGNSVHPDSSESPRELSNAGGKRERVWMIRWKQRIGIVHGSVIVGVLTRMHFRAAAVEEWLATLPCFAGAEPYLRAPRKDQFSHLHADIEAAPVRPSWHLCGRRERLGDALQRWQEQSENGRRNTPPAQEFAAHGEATMPTSTEAGSETNQAGDPTGPQELFARATLPVDRESFARHPQPELAAKEQQQRERTEATQEN